MGHPAFYKISYIFLAIQSTETIRIKSWFYLWNTQFTFSFKPQIVVSFVLLHALSPFAPSRPCRRYGSRLNECVSVQRLFYVRILILQRNVVTIWCCLFGPTVTTTMDFYFCLLKASFFFSFSFFFWVCLWISTTRYLIDLNVAVLVLLFSRSVLAKCKA